MRILFIGGTGNISTSVSRLALRRNIDLYFLNRGIHPNPFPEAKQITGDIHILDNIKQQLNDQKWDVVVNWIAFTVEDVKRDVELFRNSARQYIFISSASIYQKPLGFPIITESTPLSNPYWQYSRNKIACENYLMEEYRNHGFPVTIVRPSHTYDTIIPVVIGGGSEYTTIDRMKKEQEVIIHGDGNTLWTLTHSEDFAKGFLGLLGNQQTIGEAFHITSDERLTWNQIHEIIADTLGVKLKPVYIPSDIIEKFIPEERGSLSGDKAYNGIFDNSKIKRFIPTFTAEIPFREGIKKTIQWFESDPSRQKILPATNAQIDNLITRFKNIIN